MWPLDAMDVLAGRFAASVAVATLPALTVGTPPTRSGGFAVVPLGTLQFAIVSPQTGLGGGGDVLTVSVSLAKLPVSTPPTSRWLDVFEYVPVAGAVTETETMHLPFAATVALLKEIEAAPTAGANVG